MDVSEVWGETDRARRRKSDVQEKFYNFLNRSAQSLTRSNSQGGKARRVRDKEPASNDRDPPRASHAAASRLPVLPGSPDPFAGSYSSVRTTPRLRTNGLVNGSTEPRKSSSPPLSSRPQHKDTVPSSSRATPTPNLAYTYNTPPHTPSSSRHTSDPSSPSSPTAGRSGPSSDLLLNRPVARPITPSNSSSTGRRVLGVLLPSSSARRPPPADEKPRKRSAHTPRSGSGSSSEPLLLTQSHTSDRNHLPTPSNVGIAPSLATRPARVKTAQEGRTESHLPPLSTSTRSQRVAGYRDDVPASPTSPSRKTTPKLDFWRSATTPRAASGHGEKDQDKGKQRAVSPVAFKGVPKANTLHTPQPRAPVTFLPEVPRLQRTPPTPQKGESRDNRASPRVDSFMSDSMPLPLPLTPPSGGNASALPRLPAFSQQDARRAHTPLPTGQKLAPAISIERSRSAPGTSRGRISPCLRIPSPKFLNKDKDKDRDKDKEKETQREKRRVTPESVGSPILRETRVPAGEKTTKLKPSVTHMRRTAHGTFDFERPGSRTSSKSGQSESRGTRSDDEKEDTKAANVQNGRKDTVPTRTIEPAKIKPKAPSPVPPLPTPRLKPRSPPPNRTRSPLASSNGHTHSSTAHGDVDDSALPRLSSGLGRRGGSSNQRTHRTQASLPPFAFEPAASTAASSSRPSRDASVRSGYVDTNTGLMWAPTRLTENAIPEDGVHVHFSGARHAVSTGAGKNTGRDGGVIPPRELAEATAVIAQFKSALDDAGFATLQKYVRRYDAQAIPLEGSSGLLARVRRLLETSAPRVDERQKRQLFDSFVRVVSQVS
ncbi:hypothetical protein DFH11DRAFT_689111 [Phellopilus nigrolimitatus]|nr:hypothetical protein DFH11DRAFT_689111 [Phellopilus nigrolimitatus]